MAKVLAGMTLECGAHWHLRRSAVVRARGPTKGRTCTAQESNTLSESEDRKSVV